MKLSKITDRDHDNKWNTIREQMRYTNEKITNTLKYIFFRLDRIEKKKTHNTPWVWLIQEIQL